PMVPGLAGGEWWRACGSRGKWWSGAENRDEGSVSLNVEGRRVLFGTFTHLVPVVI
nr:hypothetical protein [Tanacetum cinerariifolium]